MIDWMCRVWLRLWVSVVAFCSKAMTPAVNRLAKNIAPKEFAPAPKHKDTLYRCQDEEYQAYRDALFEQSDLEYQKLSDKQCARRMRNIQEVQLIIDNSSEVQSFDGDFPKTYRNGSPPKSGEFGFTHADFFNDKRKSDATTKKSKTSKSSKKRDPKDYGIQPKLGFHDPSIWRKPLISSIENGNGLNVTLNEQRAKDDKEQKE